jgi:peptidoglycan/xylan/chitin deacetylase (PgdA/CDA1 family)
MLGFSTGVFTISLDLELIWGTRDYAGTEGFRKACVIEREVVIDRLLELFLKYDISATWCVVGHLFLDRCEIVDGRKHADVFPRNPAAALAGWFSNDPATDEASAPTFYGRSLIDKIRLCPVKQEIGSHSFAHMIFDERYCTREAADRDIAKCVAVAGEQRLTLRSFVYPRNRVSHTDVLREYGFTSYRGVEPEWYERRYLPRAVKRAAHLASVVFAVTPPVVVPMEHGGVWNIAGSMIFLPMHGVRGYIPASRRSLRAMKGLDRAVEKRCIFHLWFHPTNMAVELEAMFGALEHILMHARELRDRQVLRVMTMQEIAQQATRAVADPGGSFQLAPPS